MTIPPWMLLTAVLGALAAAPEAAPPEAPARLHPRPALGRSTSRTKKTSKRSKRSKHAQEEPDEPLPALTPGPSPAPDPAPAAEAPAPREGSGRVAYATAGRAYLDRGSADGLVEGASLPLRRRGRPAGSCQLELVTAHHATCKGGGARPGDTFAVQPPAAPAVATRPALPPPPPPAQLAQERESIAAAPYPMVEFKGGAVGGAFGRRLGLEVGLGHETWASTTASGGPFQVERLDVAMRGAEVGAGLRLSIDATALRWSRRPEGYRFPYAADTQLYVYQAELSSREGALPIALTAGRIWPWHAPGMPTLDGVQAGWRNESGTLELGVLGGLVPDPVMLTPGLNRPVGGAYAAFTQADEGSLLRWFQQEARASLASTPEGGTRVELESLTRAWLTRAFDLGLDVRFGAGQTNAPALLEAARLDFGLRPLDGLRILGGARYVATPVGDVPLPGDPSPGNRALHGDFSAAWDIVPWISVALTGVYARDYESRLIRALGGPEVSLPKLFGGAGGLSVGYQREWGWTFGQSTWVQLTLTPLQGLRLLGRASYFEDTGTVDQPLVADVSVYLSADYQVAQWLSIRASVLARTSVASAGSGGDGGDGGEGGGGLAAAASGSNTYGLVASVGIGGRF